MNALEREIVNNEIKRFISFLEENEESEPLMSNMIEEVDHSLKAYNFTWRNP